ncbi:MAG: hypothetical protein LQ337_006205 [Flavoplaca oasis]|nr:MAG: hypothetical protein LQ337_006205 [Flavoplaca oasis]
MIFNLCCTASLKALRGVSRQFNEVITPLLFKHLSMHTWEVGKANVPEFYAKHVKSLTLFAVDYERLSRSEWIGRLRNQIENEGRHLNEAFFTHEHHVEQGFKIYEQCRKDKMYETQGWMFGLFNSLQWMKCLENVVVTNAKHEVETDHYNNCGLDSCDYRDKDHTIFGLAPASGLPEFGRAILNPLLGRLAKFSCPIKTLDVSSSPATTNLKHRALQYTPPSGLALLLGVENMLSQMTMLSLDLNPVYMMNLGAFQQPGKGMTPMACFLSCGKNLRTLKLELSHHPERTDIRTMLLGCAFPKLTTLILNGFEATTADLLSFIDGSPLLVIVRIFQTHLKSGSWSNVLAHWQKTLKQLNCIQFVGLGGSTLSTDFEGNPIGVHDDIWQSNWFLARNYVDQKGGGMFH